MTKNMNSKGRRKHEPFVKLTREMVKSKAWLNLKPAARCIYIEIKSRYNGINNGEISMSHREAAIACRGSKSKSGEHFDALVEHGFIKLNNKGHFRNKHASTWVITSESFMSRPPTQDWRLWQSDKKRCTQ